MKLIFHGAAREIGKSCIELELQSGARYLLDAGVKFVGNRMQYPQYLRDIGEVDGVFLSHAHMDHSGALAFLEKKRLDAPIYSTPLTWEITKLLLEDARHLEQLRKIKPSFGVKDINRVEQDIHLVSYDKDYRTRDGLVRFRFLNSGHIPGGASVLLEAEGKRILYTSDVNVEPTRLMKPANLHKGDVIVDTLIIEGTYGTRNHPQRQFSEEGIVRSIHTCIEGGGSALIPVFGVGRSQEVLLVLAPLMGTVPIYLDGMARQLLDIVLRSDDSYLANIEKLRRMGRYVKKVSRSDRARLAKQKGIVIVSTSGMVEGGPSSYYARSFIEKKENFILLTGYQANGTQGRSMYDDHVFFEEGNPIPVECHMRKFDFSAHADRSGLHALVRGVTHKNLVLQHGDPDALDALADFGRENLDSKVYSPQLGDEILL